MYNFFNFISTPYGRQYVQEHPEMADWIDNPYGSQVLTRKFPAVMAHWREERNATLRALRGPVAALPEGYTGGPRDLRAQAEWAAEQRALGNIPYTTEDGELLLVPAELASLTEGNRTHMNAYTSFRNQAARGLGWKRNFR
jgi:hypothetical protein